jgi:hypothetical protein
LPQPLRQHYPTIKRILSFFRSFDSWLTLFLRKLR